MPFATLIGTGLATAGAFAWAVRGRSATIFGPSVWRGPRDRRAIALTFDDGPSESTPELLALLAYFKARATFFVCGAHVRRLPEIACAIRDAGHEIGNHTDMHRPLYFQSPSLIRREVEGAQKSIREVTGVKPVLFRAPYGARWPGLRAVQRDLGLLGVTWTVIGRDWRLDAPHIADRVLAKAGNGGIICLHDGREMQVRPDIGATLRALERILPELARREFRLETVSQLLCPTN